MDCVSGFEKELIATSACRLWGLRSWINNYRIWILKKTFLSFLFTINYSI